MLLRDKTRLSVLVTLALLLALCGCGGGSGGSNSSGGSSAITSSNKSALDVYVTDGFGDAYKQVLITLYKIELTTDGKTFQTVYSDTSGQTLDLASLASTAKLLASVNVPTGSYTEARVTFGDHITLVAKDGTSTSMAVDPSIGTDTNGQIAITVSTPTKVVSGQSATVIIDFKLAEFKLVGTTLHPSVACDDDSAIATKQRTVRLNGTVANLTATGFDLQGEDGRTVPITLTSSTTVTSGQTGKTVALANGQSVIVEGTYDPTTKMITATAVTLNDYTTFNHEVAEGTVASVNTTAGSFVLTVHAGFGIKPTGGTITIQTNTSTQFVKGRDQQGSLTDVATGGKVIAGGVFDTTTQTLTASYVLLH